MPSGPEGAAVEMNSVARRGRPAALGYGRLLIWLAPGALFAVFASYVALPIGLAWYMPRLAAQHGIRLDVERVRVEPFGSRLRLHRVRIATAGDPPTEWSSVEARVDLAELLSGRLVLDGFRLSGAKLHAGGPWSEVAGLLPDAPARLPEQVSIGELVIEEVELASISETLGRPVTFDWLRISSIDDVFRPEGAEVRAEVSVGKGRSSLRGRLGFDATDWSLDAEVGANDVPLDGLPALPGAGGSWRGRLHGSGPVRLVHAPDNGTFSAAISGRWAVDGPELAFADALISGARADWDGAAFITFSGDAVGALGVDAETGLREIRVDVADVLEVETPELMLRIDASQAPGPRLSVEGRSPAVHVSGKGRAFEAIEVEATNLVSQVALTFAGEVGVEIDRLASGALAVKLPDGRTIDVERVVLERGAVESGMTTFDSVEEHEVAGDANEGRLRADRLAARGARVDPSGAMVFATAEADGITLEDTRGRASTSARTLRAGPLTVRESGVEIGALSLSGLESTIGLDEDGDWELPALPAGAGEAQSSSRVRIGEASIPDSGSIIRIVDRTTEPDFTARIDISSAVLRGFDSTASGVPARFSIEATYDVFTALQAGGVLTPTPTGADLDLDAMIRGLSLRTLSPYPRLHLGRQVESGHADVTLDITVRGPDLEGVAGFILSDVVLGESVVPGESALPVDSPGPGTADPSPLDVALDLLEDGQGRVALEVPLRGKLDAPGFDFDGLLTRALANAALEGAQALRKAE